MIKILTIIGARPQFVKASVVSKALRAAGTQEVLVDTGQHYDDNMAQIFFEEMSIPKPDYNLGVGSGTHAAQTSASLVGIEKVILAEKPDYLLVYGDTNATLAGALAASKLHVRLIHVEAGLRSYNKDMPEEINRRVTDVLSDLLFVPTKLAASNLEKEGLITGVHIVGDVMVDALYQYTRIAETNSDVLNRLGLTRKGFLLMTIHRPSNADHNERLAAILEQVAKANLPTIFPVHPRSRDRVQALFGSTPDQIRLIDPVGYLDMMLLEKYAKMIVTDSGGVQKEAYLHKTPCLTVRAETEWVETVNDGWNYLVGDDLPRISSLIDHYPEPGSWSLHYGDGQTAQRITRFLLDKDVIGNHDQ